MSVTRSLVRRAIGEHRIALTVLAGILAANALGYAFYVYPLSQRVNNVAERTTAAEADLSAARLQQLQARNTLTGRARSAERLDTFYSSVLPKNFVSARQLASPRLDEYAQQAGVRVEQITSEIVPERDHLLTRVDIRMKLSGAYSAIRRFIYQLERAKEFVAIQNVRINEESSEAARLNVQMDLATYYKDAEQ